jgi:hypothetical protein
MLAMMFQSNFWICKIKPGIFIPHQAIEYLKTVHGYYKNDDDMLEYSPQTEPGEPIDSQSWL